MLELWLKSSLSDSSPLGNLETLNHKLAQVWRQLSSRNHISMIYSTCRKNRNNFLRYVHRVISITLFLTIDSFHFIYSVNEFLLKIFVVGFWDSLVNRKILTLIEFISSERELLRGKICLFPSFSEEIGNKYHRCYTEC